MPIRRLFLALAAVWDLLAGAALLLVPEGRAGIGTVVPTPRSRAFGGVVVVFGLLYGALAVRPGRPLLILSLAAKTVGGVTGVVGVARRRRDLVTVVSIADAAWVPGFLAAVLGPRPRP